jgi:hypothetical protein
MDMESIRLGYTTPRRILGKWKGKENVGDVSCTYGREPTQREPWTDIEARF